MLVVIGCIDCIGGRYQSGETVMTCVASVRSRRLAGWLADWEQQKRADLHSVGLGAVG